MSYTADSDLLFETDAVGNTTTFTWSGGLKQTMTDALGRVTTYVWNATTRQLRATQDALGNLTSLSYDGAGNQISVQDPLGRLTTFSYDGNRRQLTRTNALGGVASSVYDPISNLIASTDELGRTATYAYDQRSWQTSVTQPVSLQPPAKPGIALPHMLPTPLGSVGVPFPEMPAVF